ncbi:MAG: methyltransferase family protein [Gemmatimonadaceae bacterium]
MISPTTTIQTLWVVWLLGWVLAAAYTGRTVAHESAASRLTYGAFTWVGALFLFVHWDAMGLLLRHVVPASTWISWTGVALVAIGLSIAVWARVYLGKLWSGAVTLKADHTIVRRGPYAAVRHPIYSGLLLAIVGTAILRGTAGAFLGVLLLVVGIVLKLQQEERLLIEHFGAAYRSYQQDVAALIPHLL